MDCFANANHHHGIWKDGWKDGWNMEGWMDGRMDGWMEGWMEGWMDGRMDIIEVFFFESLLIFIFYYIYQLPALNCHK